MPLTKPKIRLGAWKRIPYSLVDIPRTKSDLTIPNASLWKQRRYTAVEDWDDEDEEWVYLFQEYEEDGALYVPRNYKPRLVRTDLEEIQEVRSFDHVTWPKDRIKFRNNSQKKAYNALVAKSSRSHGRLLVLGCGKGKTVISLKAAMTREVPVAVIVDTSELQRQWVREIVDHCRIPEDNVGIYGGGKKQWKGYPIVVMMTQTLMRKEDWEYPDNFRKYFGLTIFDEVHIMGAPVFSRCATIFYGERWGLTATPYRVDSMDKVFKLHISSTPCYQDITQDLVPKVFVHQTGIDNPDVYVFGPKTWKKRWWTEKEIRALPKNTRKVWALKILKTWGYRAEDILLKLANRVNVPRTITEVSTNKKRNDQVLDLLQGLADEKRKVLVIGSRTDQLIYLANTFESRQEPCGLCHGKVKKKERDRQLLDFDIVFAAQKMLLKGFDRPDFDTLVVLSLDPEVISPNNVQQTMGRIQRELPGKKDIEVHYFYDEKSNMFSKKLKILKGTLKRLLGKYKYTLITPED